MNQLLGLEQCAAPLVQCTRIVQPSPSSSSSRRQVDGIRESLCVRPSAAAVDVVQWTSSAPGAREWKLSQQLNQCAASPKRWTRRIRMGNQQHNNNIMESVCRGDYRMSSAAEAVEAMAVAGCLFWISFVTNWNRWRWLSPLIRHSLIPSGAVSEWVTQAV